MQEEEMDKEKEKSLSGKNTPDLSEGHRQEAERRTTPPAQVVYEAVRREGEGELGRPTRALAWSGLAAGLSMGFSLVAEGLLRSHLPAADWSLLLSKLGYCAGFLIVVLGRQQLFTENTLTVIIPLLTRRSLATLIDVLRLWGVVLFANLLGVLIFAWVVAKGDIFAPDTREAFRQIGVAAMSSPFWTTMFKAVFAGWLLALMVWLLPVADASRVLVIIIVTYLVGLADFSHIIGGSSQALYAVISGAAPWKGYLFYLVATLFGNILGGVSLVAALNHAQVVAGKK
jgi:formate/nitrite transporter FocA (FNT family)